MTICRINLRGTFFLGQRQCPWNNVRENILPFMQERSRDGGEWYGNALANWRDWTGLHLDLREIASRD